MFSRWCFAVPDDIPSAAPISTLVLPLAASTSTWERYGFTIAFKGVFLEGLEVAFIVVTFGGTQRNVGLAAIGAAAALVVVLIAAVIVHEPLTRVPENTVKFGVGVMLTSFGIFWTSEGAGIDWPAGDASLLVVIAFVVGVSLALVAFVDRSMGAREITSGEVTP